jgi:hypothetical protein
VNCGPFNAPIAKTIPWAIRIQRFVVTRPTAKTIVVRTAEKRAPLASIETAFIFSAKTFVIIFSFGR